MRFVASPNVRICSSTSSGVSWASITAGTWGDGDTYSPVRWAPNRPAKLVATSIRAEQLLAVSSTTMRFLNPAIGFLLLWVLLLHFEADLYPVPREHADIIGAGPGGHGHVEVDAATRSDLVGPPGDALPHLLSSGIVSVHQDAHSLRRKSPDIRDGPVDEDPGAARRRCPLDPEVLLPADDLRLQIPRLPRVRHG